MSDTEYQAKGATPDDVVMEEEDAPITDGQEPVPATDEEPAVEETEAKESDDKAASPKKDAASKPKSKTSAKKGNGTSSRKMAGKIAKADAKADAKETGKFKVGDLVTGRVKGFPFWREYPFADSVSALKLQTSVRVVFRGRCFGSRDKGLGQSLWDISLLSRHETVNRFLNDITSPRMKAICHETRADLHHVALASLLSFWIYPKLQPPL